jgi:uncharacterized membrane protein YeaQ/YmgE (transglycosylase-associated protein family)
MDSRTVSLLAFIIVLGFFSIVGTLIFHEVPAGSKDILGPLIGVIGAAVGTIVGYIWGSSSGSKAHSAAKDELTKMLTGTGDGAKITDAKSTLETKVTTVTTPNPPATTGEGQ